MKNTETKPIVVLGGTGKTGGRIVARLQRQGIPVRVGSRSATPAFDWSQPETWDTAIDGTSAIYISYYPDLALPGAVDAVRQLTDLALSRGVTRIVLLTGRGEAEAQAAEEVLKASGAVWTILRASWFAQNFSETFLLDAVQSGMVALPVGNIGEPFVDADDIADVAVAALTQPGHENILYELTGPRLLTFADAIAEIAVASGHAVSFQHVPAEAYASHMKGAGVPEDMVSLVLYLFTTVLDGRNTHTCDGVRQALGRDPTDFAIYAQQTAQSGVWSLAA